MYILHVRTFICVSVCRTLMPFRIVIRNLTVYLRYVGLRTVNFPRLCCMCIYFRTYMFFFIYLITLQAYIGNYQTITNTDVVTNDQPIGRNESNALSSNNLRSFRNNLGLVFHTTYSCIFHSCYLLLLFPLPHFQSPRTCTHFHVRYMLSPFRLYVVCLSVCL